MANDKKKTFKPDFEALAELVERCEVCKPAIEAKERILDAARMGYQSNEFAILGLPDLEIKCNGCGGRGFTITAKGKALIAFMGEFLTADAVEQEFPF